MKILKSFKDLTDENLKECTASVIQDLYSETLNKEMEKISKDYEAKTKEKETEIKAAQDKIAEVEKKTKEVETKLTEITENYNKIVKANQEKEAVETYSARMEALNNRFDLTDKEQEILASDVKSIKDDAEFEKFLEKQEILLAAKSKTGKVFDPKTKKWVNKEDVKDKGADDSSENPDGTKKTAKASVDDNSQKVLDDAIKNGEKAKVAVANAGDSEESLTDKAKKAFSIENWTTEDKRKNRK